MQQTIHVQAAVKVRLRRARQLGVKALLECKSNYTTGTTTQKVQSYGKSNYTEGTTILKVQLYGKHNNTDIQIGLNVQLLGARSRSCGPMHYSEPSVVEYYHSSSCYLMTWNIRLFMSLEAGFQREAGLSYPKLSLVETDIPQEALHP